MDFQSLFVQLLQLFQQCFCASFRDCHHHMKKHQSNFSVLAGIADVFYSIRWCLFKFPEANSEVRTDNSVI